MQLFLEALFLVFCMVALVYAGGDQSAIPSTFLKGYNKSQKGNVLQYHSPHPDVRSALLVRSIDASMYIEWRTEPVPEDFKGDYCTFLWMFGIDVNAESRKFDLYIDDTRWFTFANPENSTKKVWTVRGETGAELTFISTLVDKYDDFMGYATLKVPKSAVTPGKALTLRVVGERANSNAWYMTFESAVEERVDIQAEEVMVREKDGLHQLVRFDFVHVGHGVAGSISVGEEIVKPISLQLGHNSIVVKIPEVKETTEFPVTIKLGEKPAEVHRLRVEPIRKWTVYLVQHTHTDIGYTRPQSEILPEHLRFIDYALDYCDKTEIYPDDAKFRWTCESSWPVFEYIKSRPSQQVRRLAERVREGRIEVTGMFFNMSEIIDENILVAQLRPLRLFEDNGINVQLAMQDDVNGIGWCLADYFPDIGIKYLIMGEHGHRALIPFDKPTAFWWLSPAGKKVLAFRADHYMTANFWGINTGRAELFEEGLLRYLRGLTERDYPYHRIAVQYSGFYTDNSPPSLLACDLIAEWNKRYEWPKIRNATASEFMRYVEEHHSQHLPVYKAAWPDWWTDGFGSAARETAVARKIHAEIIAHQGLLAAAALCGVQIPGEVRNQLERIQQDLVFYDEHTFGAAESISDPSSENSVIQWGEKSSYVWTAEKNNKLLREHAMGLLQPLIPRSERPTIFIFNSLNWKRSGYVEVYIDHEIIPENKTFSIVDAHGETIYAQPLESRADGTYYALWAREVPAMGYSVYTIEVDEGEFSAGRPSSKLTLENQFYRFSINRERGAVKGLYDKTLQLQLVDRDAEWALGQFIYERLSNRNQLEHFRLEKATRTTLTEVNVSEVQHGPLWQSVVISGLAPECADGRGVSCEIRLFHTAKRIDFLYGMRKLAVEEPEAVYVAFPFSLPGWKFEFEAQGGLVRPGADQLPGTASDWNTVQNYVVLRNDGAQIVFSSPEIPLVQLGGLNLGDFSYVADPKRSHVFSWVLNNYWVTNFKASQQGELKWRYSVSSAADDSKGFAARFGWGTRIPLLWRVFPARTDHAGGGPLDVSLLELREGNPLLVCAGPSLEGNCLIVHLREIEGRGTSLDMRLLRKNKFISDIKIADALGRDIGDCEGARLHFAPFEVKFLKLVLAE